MNRRTCINCQRSWYSLADHELEAPHTCPRCGDQLTPISELAPEPEPGVQGRVQAATRS
jgi:ribosomal protein S27AE